MSIRSSRKGGSKESRGKVMIASSFKHEHLDADKMILKAGMKCMLNDGEDSEKPTLRIPFYFLPY